MIGKPGRSGSPKNSANRLKKRAFVAKDTSTSDETQWHVINSIGYPEGICSLLESDVPISPSVRRWIANTLRAFYAGAPIERYLRKQRGAHLARQLVTMKRNIKERTHVSAMDAEEQVAERYGLSVEAMRKRIQRGMSNPNVRVKSKTTNRAKSRRTIRTRR